MKTLVIYYSYTGHTKIIAEGLAIKESADIVEIKDIKRPGKFNAYTACCIAAIRGKARPIQPFEKNMNEYDNLILLSPVWASNPPPAVNSVLSQIPADKTVEVKMISGSGKCGCKERLESLIENNGSKLTAFEDIKA